MLSGDPSCVCGFLVYLLSTVSLKTYGGDAGIAICVCAGRRTSEQRFGCGSDKTRRARLVLESLH
jgi:hypothetical protein